VKNHKLTLHILCIFVEITSFLGSFLIRFVS